ncbi:MAG: hypothetical protein Q4E76_04420 [Tissierellia bacterium]|nr:hypothetical protein [Tissierellia bacterium]
MLKNIPILPKLGLLTLPEGLVYGVGFLAHPVVAGGLVIVGVVSLVLGLFSRNMRGLSLLSIVAFGLYFLGALATGTGSLLLLGVFLLGIVLLVLEALAPGFGLMGTSGIIAVVAGLFFSVESPLASAVSLVVASALSAASIRYLVQNDLAAHYIQNLMGEPPRPAIREFPLSVGDVGVAASPLRPSGNGIFDGELYSVMTGGSHIQQGRKIQVVKLQGSNIYVEEIREP